VEIVPWKLIYEMNNTPRLDKNLCHFFLVR
jgi:hypothetical protein